MNLRLSKKILLFVFSLTYLPGYAYQVWSSTVKTPGAAALNLDQWSLLAPKLQGLNTNFAPTPRADNPNTEQWKIILSQYVLASKQTYQPFKRGSFIESEFSPTSTDNWLTQRFDNALELNYKVTYIMLYNDGEEDGTGLNVWKDDDITLLRNWLDTHGHSDLKLLFNARSYNSRSKLSHPAIAGAVNEGSPEKWDNNDGSRKELLKWMIDTEYTKNKIFVFHIPVDNLFDTKDVYVKTRKMIRDISQTYVGPNEFLKSDNVVILPMSYSPFPLDFPFMPEVDACGESYQNSMSGLLLSLIEQKDMFEGNGRSVLSVEETVSYKRSTTKNTARITFRAIPDKYLGDPDFIIDASSTNNNVALTCTSSDTSIASCINGKVQIKAVGRVTITDNQDCDLNFYKAESVSKSFRISKIITGVLSMENSAVVGSIYPNPCKTGILHLPVSGNWHVTDQKGLLVMSGSGSNVNMSDKPSGVYFIKTNYKVERVIVE